MLFVVSTPIGNLEDLCERAIKTLSQSDLILAEDTRRSVGLLNHLSLKKKLLSYHKFSEKKHLDAILKSLREGKVISLICDAGTPCINDPGQILVDACLSNSIPVTVIPGPCSIIQALVASGFDTKTFQFIGFLENSAEKQLKKRLGFLGTTIAFVSPNNLLKTLKLLGPKQRIAVAREMTKKFEEILRGDADELYKIFSQRKILGEFVLIIEQSKPPDDLSIEETVEMLQEYHGLPLKEAILKAARIKKIPKKEVYRKFHR